MKPKVVFLENVANLIKHDEGRTFEVIYKTLDSAKLTSESFDAIALEKDPSLELSYIVAPPRMARYMEISSQIYSIYLKYVSKEDVIVYSIDEVFIDATSYLKTYKISAQQLAMRMIREVLYTTGITATAGIGKISFLPRLLWTSWQSTWSRMKMASVWRSWTR